MGQGKCEWPRRGQCFESKCVIIECLSQRNQIIHVHTQTHFVFNQQLQFDGFQCGVWVCFFISLVYERLRSGTDLSTIDLTEHSLHVTNHLARDQKRHNSDCIADLRSTYTDDLLRAKAAGILATSNKE